MEQALSAAMAYLIPFVEACGALVIVLATVRTIVLYLAHCFRRNSSVRLNSLRIRLGRSMVMGLEFQVAADILKTALSPEWNDILQLAALVALRTVLNYLMEHELRLLNRQEERE